jgi:hypothetical protein
VRHALSDRVRDFQRWGLRLGRGIGQNVGEGERPVDQENSGHVERRGNGPSSDEEGRAEESGPDQLGHDQEDDEEGTNIGSRPPDAPDDNVKRQASGERAKAHEQDGRPHV